jgi:TonB family protein
MARILSATVLAVLCACGDDGTGGERGGLFSGGTERPDEPPVVVNRNLPFRYPAALYARRVQGNVMLRLYIDRDGHARADSTRVEESSGYPQLDSAAVVGSQELQFVPAKLHGESIGVVVLFPVYFRHPEAPPLPGDTILGRDSAVSGGSPTNRGATRSPSRP